MKTPLKRLSLVSRLGGFAGPAAFQRRLEAGLQTRGIEVCYSLEDRPYDAVLVIGGTRRLNALREVQQLGIPIFQRLNGMNWIHRRTRTGLRHFLKAEFSNMLLRTIRGHFASGVIYQSAFAHGWWEQEYGRTPVPAAVIHNAVPLDQYTVEGTHDRPQDRQRILVVEGNLGGGYEAGLYAAFDLVDALRHQHNLRVELQIAGAASADLRTCWSGSAVPVEWLGPVLPEHVPELDRSAHLLYSSDINPACPNSVIEALACGLPVVAFNTGALPELVPGSAGRLADYGTDPWKLEPPNISGLVSAAVEVLGNQDVFRAGARQRALEAFSLDLMVDRYLEFLTA
ncbi:MAG: glycosyltransferase family 4 protein [Anaerolineales bacterium]|nr:glycosyltransferase family 4 protein [Anaerolineales bacterium]